MARLISERNVVGIRLLTLEISDGEAFTYIQTLKHTLETLEPKGVEALTGAFVEEVEGMLEDLLSMTDQAEWEDAVAPVLAPAD
ncbi:MAG: hypothetical protein KJZ86_07790 [Caldilineaceae bacterium]|nr:hypothetical protein [Caldilineaceae bacterium]HRJ44062.1 hypothetical protein [Caldilineaceae bacterium]